MSALLVLSAVGVAYVGGDSAGAATSSGPLSITTTSLNPGEVAAAYSQRLTATGGTTPYSWSTSSPLPIGLTLSAHGVLSGTPQSPIDEELAIVVTDATGAVQDAFLELVVIAGPSITTTTVPPPIVGEVYSIQLTATGGVLPYTWSVSSGPLPLGLVLNSTGLLSGLPTAAAKMTTTIALADAGGARVTEPLTVTVAPSPEMPAGYLVSSATGAVSAFASPGVRVPQTAEDGPRGVAGIAANAAGTRYWIVTTEGQVSASPGVPSFGSVSPRRLSGYIVGIAATPSGTGYWIASSTGQVYGFGAARAFGSVAPRQLSGHIVGIAASPNDTGYWLASSTGHVYAFGAAHVQRGHGRRLPSVVGIASDPNGGGYWLVTRSGRVDNFGDAALWGSIPGADHLRSVVGIAASPDGNGYWLVTRNGTVTGFGSATSLAPVEVGAGSGVVAIASMS